MRQIKVIALAVLCLSGIGSAHAHRQWLLPSASQVDGKEPWVTIDGGNSEDLFDIDTNGLKLEGMQIIAPDGQSLKPAQILSGKQRTSADVKLAQPGTYRFVLLSENVMASYKLNGEQKRWRGSAEDLKKEIPAGAEELVTSTTVARVETYVTAGQPSKVDNKPGGNGLELVPLDHPTEYQVGQPARFRFLLDGQPAANLKVAIVPGGVRYRGVLREVAVTTDARGEFTVKWAMPQMYWINASYPPRVDVPEGQPRPMPVRRYNYGGTFEVLPQ